MPAPFEENARPEPTIPSAPLPTVADVADLAGVSRQTVSNVLNAPHRVRPATRHRVESAIAALGYQPNQAARALRGSASRLIGYRVEPVDTESLGTIHDRFLHALAAAGREVNYHLLTFAAEDVEDEVAACSALFRTGTVDGFVLYGLQNEDRRPHHLMALGAPFAAFGRGHESPADYFWIDVDNAAGTAAAVEHLVERGHRRIAFLGTPPGTPTSDLRAAGWRDTLDKYGLLAACHTMDLRAEDSVANGWRLCTTLLERKRPPTAFVTATDTLAVGAWQAGRDSRLSRSHELAVVGYDDTPTMHALGISSVRQPIEAVGRAVLRALIALLPANQAGPGRSADAIVGEDLPGQLSLHQLLRPSLVVRASTAAPAPSD